MTATNPSAGTDENIDPSDEQSCAAWAEKLDVSPDQLKEAIEAVGNFAPDVEMHLKGTRSTTNADRVEDAGS